MKKIALTIAIVIGMTIVSFGQNQSYTGSKGLFERGETRGPGGNRDISGDYPLLPAVRDGNHQDANTPVGGGIAVLAALGGAYLLAKRRREE